MCIAIYNAKGVTFQKALLNRCWLNNNDGAGMAWVERGKIQTWKTVKDFEAFCDKYYEVKKKHSKSNMLLHFRIATHGSVKEDNTHPFMVDEDLCVIHNGIIPSKYAPTTKEADKSDTVEFVEHVLQGLKPGFEYDETMMSVVNELIGYSKLVFLNSNNHVAILGKAKGTEDLNGCWFSNDSYKREPYRYSSPKTKFFFDGEDLYEEEEIWVKGAYQKTRKKKDKSPSERWEEGREYNVTTRMWEWPKRLLRAGTEPSTNLYTTNRTNDTFDRRKVNEISPLESKSKTLAQIREESANKITCECNLSVAKHLVDKDNRCYECRNYHVKEFCAMCQKQLESLEEIENMICDICMERYDGETVYQQAFEA